MRKLLSLIAVACAVACNSPTETKIGDSAENSTRVVPAGIDDRAWASLGNVCAADSPRVSLNATQRAASPPYSHGDFLTPDDDWADVARSVAGGFAGILYDSGTPVIFLTDTKERSATVAALRAKHLADAFDLDGAQARQGRWDFAQLADWFGYLRQFVPPSGDFLTLDIQESRNRLEITVQTAAQRSAIETAFRPLHLPCYLVAIYPAVP